MQAFTPEQLTQKIGFIQNYVHANNAADGSKLVQIS